MNLSERITMNPEICHGKPTIRGLRYTVESILEFLSSGMAVEAILADYEDLEREDYSGSVRLRPTAEPDKTHGAHCEMKFRIMREDR
jgi:uncharacterized protein (DUF433 family)